MIAKIMECEADKLHVGGHDGIGELGMRLRSGLE